MRGPRHAASTTRSDFVVLRVGRCRLHGHGFGPEKLHERQLLLGCLGQGLSGFSVEPTTAVAADADSDEWAGDVAPVEKPIYERTCWFMSVGWV